MSKVILQTQTAPATPDSGLSNIYVDSTTKRLATKDDAGNIINYVPAETMKGRIFIPWNVYVPPTVPITTSPSNNYIWPIDRSITLVKFAIGCYVATTNNGTHFWYCQIKRTVDDAVVASLNTSAVAADGWRSISTTSFSISSLGTSDVAMYITLIKNGSPGNIYFSGPVLEVSI